MPKRLTGEKLWQTLSIADKHGNIVAATPIGLSWPCQLTAGLVVENASVSIFDCHYCLSRIMCLNFVLKDLRILLSSAQLSSASASAPPKIFSFSFVRYSFCQLNARALIKAAKQPIISIVSSVANKLDSGRWVA